MKNDSASDPQVEMRIAPHQPSWPRRALHVALDLIFPPICPFCGERMEAEASALCDSCRRRIEEPRPPLCALCGASVPPNHKSRYCRGCPPRPIHFDSAFAAARYEGPGAEMVKSLKFGHCLEMAPEMARRMFVALVDTLPEIGPVDFLIPVPLHWTRRWRRGFNQSEAIAAELGRLAGVPAMQRNLIRIRRTRRQTALEPGERMRNVEHAFALAEPAALDGRRVLLIDDVFTTGATANVCARVLKEAGAEAVHVFTFARA